MGPCRGEARPVGRALQQVGASTLLVRSPVARGDLHGGHCSAAGASSNLLLLHWCVPFSRTCSYCSVLLHSYLGVSAEQSESGRQSSLTVLRWRCSQVVTCGQLPLQAPSSTGRDARPQSGPPRPPARGGGAMRGGGGRGGGSAPSRGGGPRPPFQVRWGRLLASPAGGWCLAGACVGNVLTPLGVALQGSRGGASGSRGTPSGGRGGRGGGSRRFSEASKDGIIANDQIPCVPAAACAALALPVPQSSPTPRPARTCKAC